MLSNSQTNSLIKMIQTQTGSLLQIQQDYFNCFKEAISLFNAASYLCQILQSHKLQLEQRMISLYLLLISFHQQNPENHPFIANILFISKQTQANIERVMIYEIMILRNKNKYSSILVEDLQIIQHKQSQLYEQQKQVKKLRHNVEQKYKNFQNYESPNFTNNLIPNFLRLKPQYMSLSSSQLCWLSPGIISDVQWDNAFQVEKKLEKSRKIYECALKRTLQQQERTDLINSIELDPYSPLHIGFNVKDLNQLITYNSYIAASLVMKLSKYQIFQQYLEHFLQLPTSSHLLDVTARIIKQIKVPDTFVELFCILHMNRLIKTRDASQSSNGLALTMTAFLQCMISNQILKCQKVLSQIKSFINQFSNTVNFDKLKAMLDQSR